HQIIFANAGDPVSLDEEKLFKRFSFAGKRKRESTGLGLSIIKSICSVYQVDIKYQYADNMHMFILNF
ncbi:MAG: sensor histidine kinase, partial [Tannerellaceae bacterium]